MWMIHNGPKCGEFNTCHCGHGTRKHCICKAGAKGLGRPGGRDKESPSGQLRYFPGEKAEAWIVT